MPIRPTNALLGLFPGPQVQLSRSSFLIPRVSCQVVLASDVLLDSDHLVILVLGLKFKVPTTREAVDFPFFGGHTRAPL